MAGIVLQVHNSAYCYHLFPFLLFFLLLLYPYISEIKARGHPFAGHIFIRYDHFIIRFIIGKNDFNSFRLDAYRPLTLIAATAIQPDLFLRPDEFGCIFCVFF
jgi:hypothetical protein